MFLLRKENAISKDVLQDRLLLAAYANLLLVALLGLFLRSFPFLSSFPLEYKNLLHGHSHFAFGGWVLPVLIALVMKRFPGLKMRIAFRHWRNIGLLVLFSAYGMLLSFPVQGYKAVSIFFSTLSILATVYLTVVIWKAAKGTTVPVSVRFLKWGLLYATLSSIGPFATGPLIAMGKQGTPIYFDAIYFYLHFQYNGFFTFAVLALLYKMLEQQGTAKKGRTVFLLFTFACVPAYALSVLWNTPSILFNLMGGIGALLQLAGMIYLLKDAGSALVKKSSLLKLSLYAFFLKNLLQLLSAFPFFALMAYNNRNFVIAYLHLVLLGFISLFVFGSTLKKNGLSRYGIRLFLFSFVTTEILLVMNASSGMLHFDVPYFAASLFYCSLFFPAGVALLILSLKKSEAIPVPKQYGELFSSSQLAG